MTNKKAIEMADSMRPNAINEAEKAMWLRSLEGDVAELMGFGEVPDVWPEEVELLMPEPHSMIYPLYLAAMIDNANQEPDLYAGDVVIANNAKTEAFAWWRRKHKPKSRDRWGVM